MKRNRILALCIVLLLAVQLLTPLASAAGATLKITAPDKLPDVGQTFKVTVDLTGNTGLSAVQLKLCYDDSVVECTAVEKGELVGGMLSASNPRATRGGVGAIIAAATTDVVNSDGTLVVFTFRVKAAGDAKLRLDDTVLSDAVGESLSVSYSLPALVSQSIGSTGNTGSTGTGAETKDPGEDENTEDKDTEDEEEKPEDEPQAEVKTGSFRDVTSAHWAFASVERAAEMGLVTGYSDGTFRPDTPVTRAQFVLMLWRMCGKPAASKAASFADASADWYQDALSWAVENGYVNGTGEGTFSPNGKITRQEVVTILFRYSGGQSGQEVLLYSVYDGQYTDSGSIAPWAKSAMYWAIYNGVITGTSETTVSPAATATRAEVAAIFVRYAK